jgi:murein DD-endopeptidase MepM/ murein hydrolase activator NlpD
MTKTKNTYIHPFEKNVKTIAMSDPRAHFKHFKHSIDFLMEEGTPILAARDGVVVDVKDDSSEGGIDPKYDDMKYLNYLTIEHENGEFSQYCHLKHKGALVKADEKVKEEQKIALSGNTGFTSAPHLHFMVFKINKTKIGWESLEIRWKDYKSVIHDEGEVNKLLLTEEFKPLLDSILKSRENVNSDVILKSLEHLKKLKDKSS